ADPGDEVAGSLTSKVLEAQARQVGERTDPEVGADALADARDDEPLAPRKYPGQHRGNSERTEDERHPVIRRLAAGGRLPRDAHAVGGRHREIGGNQTASRRRGRQSAAERNRRQALARQPEETDQRKSSLVGDRRLRQFLRFASLGAPWSERGLHA